jgi:hypothetical protein
MNEPLLDFIEEPNLVFGYNQKAIDPRDGLLLYGPFDAKKIYGPKCIGIIGPERLRGIFKEYFLKIQSPVVNTDRVIARPDFPGMESIFGISIIFPNIQEIDVPQEEIRNDLKYSDSHQRVYRLVNSYVSKLISFSDKEEVPVDVWFIVIPEDVYTLGRPKSRVAKSNETINDTIKSADRDSSSNYLFPAMQEDYDSLNRAYEFEVNFHNQLKARLLESKIVTQIIRESNIDYQNYYEAKKADSEKKFDSAKAWNISTAFYYKLGGLPWKLGDIRSGVCYLGFVYKKTEFDKNSNNACCAAQMFLDSGDGMVFRGNIGPWWNPDTKEFHISKKAAKSMAEQSIQSYLDKFKAYPSEIFIHAKTFFNDEEWSGFEEASKNKCNIIGVRIKEETAFKMYRQKEYSVPRGTLLQYDDKKGYLWTKGFIPRFETQMGLETPNSLDIQITRGDADLKVVCRDILSLSKLNYNACVYGDGLPVTLKFADSIGEILTAGKDIKNGILPFKHYI